MKHLILLCLALVTLLWPFALKRTAKRPHKSLSYHLAATPEAIRFAKLVIPVVVASLGIWYFGWYVPTYKPVVLQTVLMTIIMVSCLVLAFVPYHEGTKRGLVHNIASYGGYAALMPFSVLMYAYEAHLFFAQAILVLVAMAMFVLALMPKIYPRIWNYFLYAQASYIVLFGSVLIVATYIG